MRNIVFLTPEYFEDLKSAAFQSLRSQDHLFISLEGESTTFIRFNHAKVRQIGEVDQAHLSLTLVKEASQNILTRTTRSFALLGDLSSETLRVQNLIKEMQAEVDLLPPDPYAVLPKSGTSSHIVKTGKLLSPVEAVDHLFSSAKKLDLVGIYSSGNMVRAMANSKGLQHWFSTESFLVDYSLYTENQKALKNLYAGQIWNPETYARQIEDDAKKLSLLNAPPKKLQPGSYRTYLCPSALNDMIQMFSWGCIGEGSIQQGDSPLRMVRNKARSFSPLFTLAEDFRGGEVPRFNEEGELSAEFLPLIEEGNLKNSLISSRSALEYKLQANGASGSEGLRSPKVFSGNLKSESAAKELHEGLYLSNLHYLNWSDQTEGRITGMTRYACFWVENGELRSPIENLRWDDSIFNLLGTELEALSDTCMSIPESNTYGQRNLGHASIPGALIKKMQFTL